MPEFVNEAGGPKTFRIWKPKKGDQNDVTEIAPPARAEQPSPTGDGDDPKLLTSGFRTPQNPAPADFFLADEEKPLKGGWQPKPGELEQ